LLFINHLLRGCSFFCAYNFSRGMLMALFEG
jgi:hypothetical protein